MSQEIVERYGAVDENKFIRTLSMIQFINVVDYTMIVPIGPDFARALGIPLHDIGLISGCYAIAAALSAFVCSFFLDNYARKNVMLISLAGLCVATFAAVIAWDMTSITIARICAGIFGGPLATSGIALVADYIPPERRGAAMGRVMGTLSAATILGVPFGLELSRLISWHAPFLVLGLLGIFMIIHGRRHLPFHPPFVSNVTIKHRIRAMKVLLQRPTVILSFLLIGCSMSGAFAVMPHVAAHFELNWDFPRDYLSLLYCAGGVVSFFTMRWTGRWIDRSTATLVGTLSTVLFMIVMLIGFIYYPNPLSAVLIFVLLMVAMTTNNICNKTLYSKIPPPEYRGAYTGLQICLVNMMQGIAASSSSLVLTEHGGKLLHIDTLAWIAILCYVPVPVLFYYIEAHLKRTY